MLSGYCLIQRHQCQRCLTIALAVGCFADVCYLHTEVGGNWDDPRDCELDRGRVRRQPLESSLQLDFHSYKITDNNQVPTEFDKCGSLLFFTISPGQHLWVKCKRKGKHFLLAFFFYATMLHVLNSMYLWQLWSFVIVKFVVGQFKSQVCTVGCSLLCVSRWQLVDEIADSPTNHDGAGLLNQILFVSILLPSSVILCTLQAMVGGVLWVEFWAELD